MTRRSLHRRGWTGLVVALACLPWSLRAQTSSPINDLLQRAKTALNDLQYPRADSLATEVLDLGPRLRKTQRALALQIVAAARFPEEREQRDTASARTALRDMIRLDADARFPEDVGWDGLSQLLDEVRRSTFSFSARARPDNAIVGLDPYALFHVRSSRPTVFLLKAQAKDGLGVVVLDSVGPSTEGDLRVQLIKGGKALLPTGEYDVAVTGIDASQPDTIVRRFRVVVLAPELNLLAVPAGLDSTRLRPEVERSRRSTGIAAALVIGAASVAIGQYARVPDSKKGQLTRDSRATSVGVAISLATVAAVLFDPGRDLKLNRAANNLVRQEHDKLVRQAMSENDNRRTSYRASITVDTEDR